MLQDDNCKLIHNIFRNTTLSSSLAFNMVLTSAQVFTCALRPHLEGHTGLPEGRSFPWSCFGGRVPSHYASGLLKPGVEIRQSQVVQGTRMEASEGYACTLGEKWMF